MKVLHCITSTGVGGAQVMLLRYLRALGSRARTHSVVSLMPQGEIGDEIADLGVTVHSVDMGQGSYSLRGLLRLRRHIHEVRPDLIHGWMYHGNLAARLATMGGGKWPPVVWAVHHSLQDIRAERRSSRIVMRASALLSGGVAGISYCARVAAGQHAAIGFPARHGIVIPNGIDTEEFRPQPDARERLGAIAGIPSDRLIIGNVGRDHPMKDQARMVAAVARLLERGHDVHAVLIGSGQEHGSARRAAEELGIGDRVTTLAERADIAHLVGGFDIFLLPSAWGEAFPLAVCEAMACGVPAVVTDVGDSSWIVGDTGRVVAPGDADAQADALAQLVTLGRSERQRLGRAARERICENFSIARFVEAHDTWYRSVTTPGPTGAISHGAAPDRSPNGGLAQ